MNSVNISHYCPVVYLHDKDKVFPFKFNTLFSTDNLRVALKELAHKNYALVIIEKSYDSKMLIEVTTKFKELLSTLNIFIISEIEEFCTLQKVVNLGVSRYFSPNYDAKELLLSIESIAKKNRLLASVDNYRKELERHYKELQQRNETLEKTVSLLDAKVARFGEIQTQQSDIEYISQSDILELGELETDIEGVITLLHVSTNFDARNRELLKELFKEYAQILKNYNSYNDIATHLLSLCESFDNYNEENQIFDIVELIESFVYVLKNWSLSFALNDFKNTQSYHASIINDITTIVAILQGKDDEIESDIEFF